MTMSSSVMSNKVNRRRVVVTGLGMITSLGLDTDTVWANLVEGKNGVRLIDRFDVSNHASRIAGLVPDYDPMQIMTRPEVRKSDPFVLYGLWAGHEAIRHAGLADGANLDPDRAGVIIGTGIGGIQEIESQYTLFQKRGPGRVSPFLVPKMMANALTGQMSIRFGLTGPNFAVSSACASGSHAIGLALRFIQYGDADVMVTGGAEAATTPLGLAGFCSAKALSVRNDDPERASRPFDRDRDGFVMGDGSGILVLEELEHARNRGANILAEICGFGQTADAYHITAPMESGEGAARAVKLAMKDARVNPDDLDYINAHGTSTPYNDVIETRALKIALGDAAYRTMISSSKSMLGHLLGASGGAEAAVCVKTLCHNIVHATANLENPDPECDLDYIPNTARDLRAQVIASNSFGFGGHNVTLIFKRFEK
jgi:3-oxoacyl-[acyl-carrier-protein] synthase II